MLVYRIEHKETGQGPYNHDSTAVKEPDRLYTARSEGSHAGQPTVWSDCDFSQAPKNSNAFDYFCGFESMDALKAWFIDPWIDALDANDFVLKTYKINKMYAIKGTYQVAFVKNKAKPISTKFLREI